MAKKKVPPEPRLMHTVREAAHMLHLSTTTVWNLVWSKKLPSRKVGRAVRIPREAIEKFAKVKR